MTIYAHEAARLPVLLVAFDLNNPLLLHGPLAKVLVPLGGLALIGLVCRYRRITWGPDLRLVHPRLNPALGWVVLSLLWMLGTNAALHWRGAWDFRPWQMQPLWVSAARVLGVGLLGPLAEELAFRGVLYFRLVRAGVPAGWVIGLVAAAWAALHFAYSPAVIAVIFVEGLFLGLARRYAGSLWVPVLMHISWNLYAVW